MPIEQLTTSTILNERLSKDVKLDIAQKIVFRQYIVHLAIGNIKLLPENFHVCAFKKIPNPSNAMSVNWTTIKEYCICDFGTLYELNRSTYDSETLVQNKMSFQKQYNIPMSACLFSEYNASDYNGFITSDWNFKQYNYDVESLIYDNEKWDDELESQGFNRHYWETYYSFDSNYNHNEYLANGIKEYYYNDDCAEITSTARKFVSNKTGIPIGGIGIMYCANENTNKVTNISENGVAGVIPVTYCELHKSIRTLNGYINIDWSSTGLLTVK